jgi:hypothetical protein
MSVTDGWTERKRNAGGQPPLPKAGSRSLKTALFEAGLGEYPQDPPGTARRKAAEADALAAAREPLVMPRIARQDEPSHGPAISSPGVVSPPPWLREARRGRRRSRLLNGFGWLMTLLVAGTIIGAAGRILTSGPALQSFQAARQ